MRQYAQFVLLASLFLPLILPIAHASIQAQYHWERRNFNVYVDMSCSQQWRNLIETGFIMWQVGFQFTYQYVGSPIRASDTAYFYCDGATPIWDNRGCDNLTGWTVKDGTTTVLNYTLTSLCALGSYAFSVPWAAQHEEGHVLGLDHSDSPHDLMYGARSGLMRDMFPSQEDFSALNTTYATAIPEYENYLIPLLALPLIVIILGRRHSRHVP